MVLRPRTRPLLRRAVAAAALGALLVPAVADAKAKPKAPVITKVTPKTALVGTKLTITGKYFTRGKAKNSVLFRRDKGKALFVKADVSTTKKLVVVLPATLEKYMEAKASKPVATRFRLRVLSAKLSKAYTAPKISPVIGPAKAAGTDGNSDGAGVPTAPEGDCDSDGLTNSVDLDDDNDLLGDALELSLLLDPCVADTDGDGVEDGFEYRSAVDLNDDNYQSPNYVVPYPAKTPYPNPLFKDADIDYDGDSLSLSVEYQLWKYTYEVNHTAARTLDPLSYSDGKQYSRLTAASDYTAPRDFLAWANSSYYGNPTLMALTGSYAPITRPLLDMNRDNTVDAWETLYWGGANGYVSDEERDEDVDGLTNFDENTGRMVEGWWAACYSAEGAFPIVYTGTQPFDADTDGDGIRDGADDQDFDDVPNVMELSRVLAGNVSDQGGCNAPNVTAIDPVTVPAETWVNPFNPCLPDRNSRTCPRHPIMGAGYPPFMADWKHYVWG